MQFGTREVLVAVGLLLSISTFFLSGVGVYIAVVVRLTRMEERVKALEALAQEQRQTTADVIRLTETVAAVDDKVCGLDTRVQELEKTVRGGLENVVAEIRKLTPAKGV